MNFEKKISMVRIVFEFYPMKGGSITHTIEAAKHLEPYLENQIIIAPNFSDEDNNFDKSFHIPIYRLDYPRFAFLKMIKFPIIPFILFGYSINILNFLKSTKKPYNLLIIHGILLGAIISFLSKLYNLKIPIIIFQDSGNIFNISKRSALSGHLAFFLFKFAKPDCLIIIDDGNEITEFINRCMRSKINYSILNHAIDTKFFSQRILIKNSDKFIILSTQRLDRFKRVDLAILAFKKFLELEHYRCNTKLILVGDGTERKLLEKMVIDNNLQDRVEFYGFKTIDEVIHYLNTSDVVIGTSLISNLNLSIQEAMACEKPVIVFNAGRTNTLIKNFYNGILVEPNNINEFAMMLNKLYKNQELRIKLGKNARNTILQEKNWENRIKKELEIYNSFLRKYNNFY